MQSANADSKSNSSLLTKQWWADFLSAGAFLRLDEDEILLWQGPFEACSDSETNKKNPNISIAYMNFFDSQLSLRLASAEPLRLSLAQVKSSLIELQKNSEFETFKPLRPKDFKTLGPGDFEKTIQSLMGQIQRGEIEKAVPVIFSRNSHKADSADLIHWMEHILRTPVSLTAFGFWEKGIGIMGATPEILFKRQDGTITSMALAGTMPRKEVGQRNSLLKDPKELHEHRLVVEDIEHQLGKWGWVKKSATKILELPTLLHLQTILEVEGTTCGLQELIQKLHPTPALGVAPRAYGYHWLLNTSDQEGRRLFGGPILFTIPKSETPRSPQLAGETPQFPQLAGETPQFPQLAGETPQFPRLAGEICLVAIRNIQWDADGCRIGAGCGVVAESKPEQEWQELQHKIYSVMQMLGIKDPKESEA